MTQRAIRTTSIRHPDSTATVNISRREWARFAYRSARQSGLRHFDAIKVARRAHVDTPDGVDIGLSFGERV